MKIGETILRLKETIEEGKEKKGRLEGQKTELLKRLKDDHGLSTAKKAEDKVNSLNTKILKLGQELEEELDEVIKKYNLEEICS